MLKFKEINSENIEYATRIQMEIFPGECAYEHYKKTIIENKEYSHYYLVYNDSVVVGITGLYSFYDINKTNTIWLGWFGVLEKYRKKGLGKKILNMTINQAQKYAKKYPIKYFRLYTSTIDNPTAQILYKETMDLCEKYNNKDVNYNGSCLIYSKALNNNEIKKWNNEFLNIKKIIKYEEIGAKKFKNVSKNLK